MANKWQLITTNKTNKTDNKTVGIEKINGYIWLFEEAKSTKVLITREPTGRANKVEIKIWNTL